VLLEQPSLLAWQSKCALYSVHHIVVNVALTMYLLHACLHLEQDALGPSREGGDDLQGRRLLAELLLQVRLQLLHCDTF
jgi:hypothetical protein